MSISHASQRWLARLLLIVTLAALPLGGTATPALLRAVQPQWQDELAAVEESASAAYRIDAEIALPVGDAGPQVRGSVTVEYTNATGGPLDALPFRFYANGPDGAEETLTVDAVTRDGAPSDSRLADDRTTLSVPISPALAPDETTTVAMDFTLAVPVDARDHYGILNINPARGTWALAQWYPILAGWDPDEGWVLDPPSEFGDPIFSTTASYDITLRAPAAWEVVSTGVVTDVTVDGGVAERSIVTGPARDVTLVLDEDFEALQTEVDGTTITSWYNPGDARIGQAVLDYAATSLAYFNEIVGPYPYTTLDLAPVDLFGAAGVEFPQLIYMGTGYYRADYSLEVPNGLEFTVAHEVLHQWWYGLVGNNQYDHAFIDEGLTNFMSSQMYFAAKYGPETGEQMVERYLAGPFESGVASDNDQVVDTPTDAFSSNSAYVYAAYNKAPMGFRAVYEAIGHDAFVAATARYYADHRFGVASPDDLLAAFETASGQDLTALWSHWFQQAAGAADV
jgi:hypothetical protein